MSSIAARVTRANASRATRERENQSRGRVAASAIDRRRALVTLTSLSTLALGNRSNAKDLAEAEAAKAARKAAVRAAAEASAKTGRGEAAFDDAAYGLSEEARTPNAHSRQEEGLKKAVRDNA